jgi:hypothetical protein
MRAKDTEIARFVGLVIGAVAFAGCSMDGSVRNAMAGAHVSPNPAEGASLRQIPPADLHLTGVESRGFRGKELSFRLITISETETCMNGDVPADPHQAQDYHFLLKSYRTPDEPAESVPTAKSTSVKVLESTRDPNDDRPITMLQVCFGEPSVVSKSTSYLVLQVDPSSPLARAMFAIWHFDSSIRHMK